MLGVVGCGVGVRWGTHPRGLGRLDNILSSQKKSQGSTGFATHRTATLSLSRPSLGELLAAGSLLTVLPLRVSRTLCHPFLPIATTLATCGHLNSDLVCWLVL